MYGMQGMPFGHHAQAALAARGSLPLFIAGDLC